MVVFVGTHHCLSFFRCFQTGAESVVHQAVGREVPVFRAHARTYTVVIAISYHCTDLVVFDAGGEVGHPLQVVAGALVKVTACFSGNA